MNTDLLIESLARNVERVRPLKPWKRAAIWSLAAGTYLSLLALVLTSRSDVAANAAHGGFLVHQAASIAMGLAAVAAAFASVVPGYTRNVVLLPLLAGSAWLAALLARVPQEWRTVGFSALVDRHELLCVVMIIGASIPPAIGLALMLRNGAPLTPRLTMALGLLASSSLANTVTCLASPHTSSIAILLWHGLTLTALCAAAGASGRVVLPWRHGRPMRGS